MNRFIPDSINIKLKGTHFNFINKNSVKYTTDAVFNGSKSWVHPFKRPHLVGHDKDSDPIGRITDYKILQTDSVDEPPDYIELIAKITDSAAIERILDGRYYTVSVGSKTNKVICSECGQNIVEDGLCEHKKGSFNQKGQRVHWIIDSIEYIESSFVNEPADPYARIDQIDIGTGWISYKEFLDHREKILSEIVMEDSMLENDAKLTYQARQNLPDSAFCYVVTQDGKKQRKFPAHDAAHVRNGLARLPQSSLPSSAKSKILACLKRRAKRYGVKVGEASQNIKKDDVDYINSIELTFGMDEPWTEEEIKGINDVFAADPNFDCVEGESAVDTTQDTTDDSNDDPTKMKKDELVQAYEDLHKKYKEAVSVRDKRITSLEDRIAELETILIDREDEVQKFLDSNAALEKQYRDAITNNILDLKKPDTTEKEELVKKLESRQIESLIDTLADLRLETKPGTKDTPKVPDPTQTDNTNSDSDQNNNEKNDPWAVFSQDNRTSEV